MAKWKPSWELASIPDAEFMSEKQRRIAAAGWIKRRGKTVAGMAHPDGEPVAEDQDFSEDSLETMEIVVDDA